MGQEELLKAIEDEAKKEAGNIVSSAVSRARTIEDETRKEAQMIREERLRELKIGLKEKKDDAINRQLALRKGRILSMKREVIQGVLDGAVERVKKLSEKEYAKLLNRLYEELKADWGQGEEPLIRLNPDDIPLIENPDCELMPDKDVSLGVVFHSRDFRFRSENTVHSRLKKRGDFLTVYLSKILFE